MKLAPLQLEGYGLLDLSYGANPDYRPDLPTKYSDDDISVSTKIDQDAKASDKWILTLNVRLQPKGASNGPYHVALVLGGVVRALPELKVPDIGLLVRVNGSSMLYGVAREVVRQLTAMGPYPAVLIPSVSFRPDAAPTSSETTDKVVAGVP